MKKSLLAVAATTAFAGVAQAQSSVTVYGIMDVGFGGSAYRGTSTTVNSSNVGAGTAGSATTNGGSAAFGQSFESTSRLGFKGSEDLGGGTSALFTVETALNPNGAASAFAFNRQTFAGLKKNGLGEATIGNQYTPIYDVMTSTDAAGLNNLVGNAVYATTIQSSTGTYNDGLSSYVSTASSPVSINATSGAYVTRASNALKFRSDRVAGLQGELFYAQANQNQSNAVLAQGSNNNTVFGVNADYQWNKLNVVAAYQNFRAQNATATATTSYFSLANGTAGSLGITSNDSQTYAAATYDFGILKAYGQYITRKAFSTVDSSYGTSRSAYQLGARSWITPTISVFATYGLGKSSYYQAGTAYANFRTAQVGSDYYLSKRTNLYALYGSTNQSSNGTTPGGVPGLGAMNYAVGVRHTF